MATIATSTSALSSSPHALHTSVDRPRLLAIIDSWEQQFHQSLDAPHVCLETPPCRLFYLLREELVPQPSTQFRPSWLQPWSEGQLQLLEKEMITRPSRTWDYRTHLRMENIRGKMSSQRLTEELRGHEIAVEQERFKKRKRGFTENCRGSGCGSTACESCYMSDSSGEECSSSSSCGEDEADRGSRKRAKLEENCHGIGCGSCIACQSLMEADSHDRGPSSVSGLHNDSHTSASRDASSIAGGSEVDFSSTSPWEENDRHQIELNHGCQRGGNTEKRDIGCHGCGCRNCLSCEAFIGDLDDYQSLTLSPNCDGSEDWLLGRLWF